jgi:peptidoglycan/LPS O-acetylase OafA/YrhL
LVAITAPAAVGPLRHAYRRIGVVSYGIYLWHLPLLAALHRLPWFRGEHPLSTLLFPVYLALSWAIAEFSFRWVEQRFLVLKDR